MIDFKGAIFDLDGTLYDSMWVWEHVDKTFLGKRGIKVPDDYLETIAPIGFVAAADYTIKRFNLSDKPEDLIQEWNELAIDAYKNKVRLKSGAKEYLEKLKSLGVKLSVATASSSNLYELALKNNGVYDLFDAFTSASEVERGKGFPDIYILAAQKIGLMPKDCVVFEDIYIGILGAKAGGFYTVAVYENCSKKDKDAIIKESDIYIHSFNELL